MKIKILSLILAFLMLGTLAACGETEVTESSVPEEVSEESVAPPKVPVINGIELKDYVVVYKNNEAETCKYKNVATAFVDYIKETFDISLVCRSDMIPEAENEIIIGLAGNRELTTENSGDYGYGGYKIVVKGTKVLIAGSYATGCYQGVEAFIEQIKASADGVFSDNVTEGEGEVIKVACVGDSITHGGNSIDKNNKTYPIFIQEMLGYDYYVLNAGVSGYSICDIDPYAYYKHNAYTQSKELKPDVVLFALGTNDANPNPDTPSKNWDNPANDRVNVFKKSTNDLLDSYVAINPDVQIYIILPASLFKVGSDHWNAIDWTANIEKYSHPLLKQIAADRNLQTVDMFGWSVENKDVFTDGLHPKDDTYKPFAQYIYDNIKDTIKKPQ